MCCVRILKVCWREAKCPIEGHTNFFHDTARGYIFFICGCNHALDVLLYKPFMNECSCPFGGIAFSPGRFAKAITELNGERVILLGPKAKPADEVTCAFCDDSPKAKDGILWGVVHEFGQNLFFDNFTRGWCAAVDISHDLGIVIEGKQMI